jgi:hypothetical protein
MPTFINFLPTRDIGDRLLQRYWDAVHPIARCVHRQSFEKQYASFWQNIANYYEPPAPLQALIFAAWFTAAVSLDETRANAEYGFSKQYLTDHMKVGTECALGKANFLRTTRVDTMQAFIMYLVSSHVRCLLWFQLTCDRFHFAAPRSRAHIQSLLELPSGWPSAWVSIGMVKHMDSVP